MRSQLLVTFAIVALGAGAFAAAGAASVTSTGTTAFHVARGSRVWLDGDSTLHKFSAEAKEVNIAFATEPAATAEAKADFAATVREAGVKGVTVKVPVGKLSSGESGLDENMVKALQGSAHPDIVFRSDRFDLVPGATAETPIAVKIHGRLAIAGTEKAVELEASATRTANGLRLTGSKDVLMSDYDVHPPVLMMGMIKTKDLVTVRFELLLEPGA